MLVLSVGCLWSRSLLEAGPTKGSYFKIFPGISRDGDSAPLWVPVPVFDNLFPHPPAQKGFLALNWSFPCHESCLLFLFHVLGTSRKAQALHGGKISQMSPLPASIQHPSKRGQLLNCPVAPRELCSSSQGLEPWFAQTEGPFRADGGSEGVEGTCSFLLSSWQP